MGLAPLSQTIFLTEDGSAVLNPKAVAIPPLIPVPLVTLGALTVSGLLRVGIPSSGGIAGATTGSTIMTAIVGLSIDSAARSYSWDGSGQSGAYADGLVENHPNATNDGRASPVSILAAPVLSALTLSNTLMSGTASSGKIEGLTDGSTLTSNLASLTVNRNDATYAFTGSTGPGTIQNALIETLPGATNSGRASSVIVQPPGPSIAITPSNSTLLTSEVYGATDLFSRRENRLKALEAVMLPASSQ